MIVRWIAGGLIAGVVALLGWIAVQNPGAFQPSSPTKPQPAPTVTTPRPGTASSSSYLCAIFPAGCRPPQAQPLPPSQVQGVPRARPGEASQAITSTVGTIQVCLRPDGWLGLPPGFSEEARIQRLREYAWANDFFAQMALSDIYRAVQSVHAPYKDDLEAAVWIATGLANPAGLAQTGVRVSDQCMRDERSNGYLILGQILSTFSSNEIQAFRDRVTYILACQGGPGLTALGRIYAGRAGTTDLRFAPFGEPLPFVPDATIGQLGGLIPFVPSRIDAWIFFFLGAREGDVIARQGLDTLAVTPPVPYDNFAREKALRWVRPFEYYPPTPASPSGLPYSDACPDMRVDTARAARAPELPGDAVAHALAFIGIKAGSVPGQRVDGVTEGAARNFQEMLREAATGRLTPQQRLRAIQVAAVRGSARAQTTLATMYTKGVLVPKDFARAVFWYRRAADQNQPEALYAMGVFFNEGVNGVAPQDLARSSELMQAAAMAGFWPAREEFEALLRSVGRTATN